MPRPGARTPEAFLWGSRRALEAICLLVLSAHNQKVERRGGNGRDQGLYALIEELKDAGLLSRQDETRFNAAREHSNLGVHIRREWIDDDFPPQALKRAWPDAGHPVEGILRQELRSDSVDGDSADGHLLHSWNRQELDKRWTNLGFRCAQQVGFTH